jgi:hypothetical protein
MIFSRASFAEAARVCGGGVGGCGVWLLNSGREHPRANEGLCLIIFPGAFCVSGGVVCAGAGCLFEMYM